MKRIVFFWFVLVLIFLGGCETKSDINKDDNSKEQISYYVCPDSSIIVKDLNLCPKEDKVLSISNSEDNEVEKNIKEPITDNKEVTNDKEVKSEDDGECKYVGSKNSDKYHIPSCIWAKKIKPENLICFGSIKEAEDKGYKPCSVCKPGNE